jgi:response regulator RpfG family c-di-GMP phosphodiesterase
MAKELNGKLLVVDDDEKLTFVLSANLKRNNFEVTVCHNGQQCVDTAGRILPDLIVMDVSMPVMDGVEATRHLKGNPRTEDIPVILLTGKTRAEDVVMGLEAGAQEYVAKPFEMEELLARIRTQMRLVKARQDLDRLNGQLADLVSSKTRKLSLLYDYVRSLNQATSIEEICRHVVEAVQSLTGSTRISLMLKDKDEHFLRCVAAVGIDPQIVDQLEINAVDGIAGQVFQSGKTFVAKTYGELAANESYQRYATDDFLSTPLICSSLVSEDEVIGVLNVTDRADGQSFSKEEVDCIRSITESAAIAISNHEQRRRLHQSVDVLLLTIGYLAEFRDEETADHLDRVAQYCRILAAELGRMPAFAATITPDFVHDVFRAAPLHDIGKVGIPDDILIKPGKLTEQEFRIMKTHTEIGRRTLEFAKERCGSVPLLDMCIKIAYGHHEKYNGMGYPEGLAGDAIPLPARIIALVDAYDAITSHRRYAPARSHSQAVEIIRSEAGSHFDPKIVEAFLRVEKKFDQYRRSHLNVVEQPEPVAV